MPHARKTPGRSSANSPNPKSLRKHMLAVENLCPARTPAKRGTDGKTPGAWPRSSMTSDYERWAHNADHAAGDREHPAERRQNPPRTRAATPRKSSGPSSRTPIIAMSRANRRWKHTLFRLRRKLAGFLVACTLVRPLEKHPRS